MQLTGVTGNLLASPERVEGPLYATVLHVV